MSAFPAFGPGAVTHRITTQDGVDMRVVIDGTGSAYVVYEALEMDGNEAYTVMASKLWFRSVHSR